MPRPHYVVRRSRSGRFNFTLLAEQGRISGTVIVATADLPRDEIERRAHDQIRALAETLAAVVGVPKPA
ncbi:hypothetical protein [Methylorubrum zatmanii]|uniref:DUF1508 domain-containing protein n=1 Tax=Methylorubrum zatmanii TaxID=29429 RepID=A0ABW1WS28_9HYPH|nr:hypothetical protein [Methylorubrum zatmanii]MBD8908051.1 hypothetical protein [Methylorubrum zatmanii]